MRQVSPSSILQPARGPIPFDSVGAGPGKSVTHVIGSAGVDLLGEHLREPPTNGVVLAKARELVTARIWDLRASLVKSSENDRFIRFSCILLVDDFTVPSEMRSFWALAGITVVNPCPVYPVL